MVDVGLEREGKRSEVTASSVFAAWMTDAGWSFNLRSGTGFFDYADSDDENEEDIAGDSRTSYHLSSGSSQTLQQIDLSAREDNAQYKPNPWSIARINAASRPRQPNATIKPVRENPAAKKRPQGAIVDAFKKQAEKTNTTNSSAQANNWRQNPSQKPASTSAIDASDKLVSAPARLPIPIAHITTSAVDLVPIPPQPRNPQQYQGTVSPSFLPRKAFHTSHPSSPTQQSQNPLFIPCLKRVQPFSSPVPPPLHSQHRIASAPRSRSIPPQASTYFRPHIIEPHGVIPDKEHVVADHVASTIPTDQGNARFAQPPNSKGYHTPVNPERTTTTSPHPRQRVQCTQPSPHYSPEQPIVEASLESETVHPSPSFARARHFFEQPAPPGTASERFSPEPPLKDKSHFSPQLPRLRTPSPPKKYANPYDQLPPSPDSEWSTLKPPTRKANGKGKSKTSDVKSGKFKLPLSFGTITPKGPPQKKARVITYLPPPPPKKQKTTAEPHPGTRDIETGICTEGPLPQRCFFYLTFVTYLSSVSRFGGSDERVTPLPASLGRDGTTEFTHAFHTIRLKRRVHSLQTRPREDPSGTHVQ